MSNMQDVLLNKLYSKRSLVTATIHDSIAITPSLRKVICTVSSNTYSRSDLASAVSKSLDGRFSVVESSFRRLVTQNARTSPPAVIGFVRANNMSKPASETTLGGMKEVAKNIFMDASDESLWEIKASESGKYLVRVGADDLDKIVQTATTRAYNVPRLTQVVSSVLHTNMEYAAFVCAQTEEVKRGFILSATEDGEQVQVYAYVDQSTYDISPDQIVSSMNVGNVYREIAATESWDLPVDVDQKKYYDLLYGYSPDYAKMLDEQIDSMTVA